MQIKMISYQEAKNKKNTAKKIIIIIFKLFKMISTILGILILTFISRAFELITRFNLSLLLLFLIMFRIYIF